jgi:hypothetical protein
MTFEHNPGGRLRGGIAALAMIILLGAYETASAEPARDPRQVVVSTKGVDFNGCVRGHYTQWPPGRNGRELSV